MRTEAPGAPRGLCNHTLSEFGTMADYMKTPDFQFIIRVLSTNVDGRQSEFWARRGSATRASRSAAPPSAGAKEPARDFQPLDARLLPGWGKL